MNFSIQVKVMPLKDLLDPQGKAVLGGLQNLNITAFRLLMQLVVMVLKLVLKSIVASSKCCQIFD